MQRLWLGDASRQAHWIRHCSHVALKVGYTLGGPNFKVMINDLAFSLSYIKYFDDTSVASVSADHNDNSSQSAR